MVKFALLALAGLVLPAAAPTTGRVLSTRGAWRGGVIVSTSVVELDDGSRVIVESLGGHVDGVGQLVNGVAIPAPGSRVRLERDGDATAMIPLVRATTGDPRDACEPPTSHPLSWPVHEIGFTVANSGAVTDGDAHAPVRRAFAAWADSGADLRFRDDGDTDDRALGYVPGGPNHNVVVWLEHEWPGQDGEPAFTLTSFDCQSGTILDADIMLNAKTFHFSAMARPDSIDVQNIVTHEVGHLIGLAHSNHDDASMFGESAPGETKKRDLAGEDIAAAREIYPR